MLYWIGILFTVEIISKLLFEHEPSQSHQNLYMKSFTLFNGKLKMSSRRERIFIDSAYTLKMCKRFFGKSPNMLRIGFLLAIFQVLWLYQFFKDSCYSGSLNIFSTNVTINCIDEYK